MYIELQHLWHKSGELHPRYSSLGLAKRIIQILSHKTIHFKGVFILHMIDMIVLRRRNCIPLYDNLLHVDTRPSK